MKTTLFIFCTIIAFSLGGCSTDDDNPPTQNADNFEPVQITPTLIAQGELDGNGAEQIPQGNLVIQNSADWQELLTKMNTINNESDNFSQTDIDFSGNMVIAVFTEVKMRGSSIQIDSIMENQDTINVFVGDPVVGDYEVISQPYYIVKIPRLDKPVVFE